jgi:hypothetical protein
VLNTNKSKHFRIPWDIATYILQLICRLCVLCIKIHKLTNDEVTYDLPNAGNQNFPRDYTESINKILCRKLGFFNGFSLTSVLREAQTELANLSISLHKTLNYNVKHKRSETSIIGLKSSDVAR